MDRYRRRRLRNTIVLTLSIGATAVGLGWLVLILGALVYEGFRGFAGGVHRNDTTARCRWWPAQSDHWQLNADNSGGCHWHPDRHPGRDLYGGIWKIRQAYRGGALH